MTVSQRIAVVAPKREIVELNSALGCATVRCTARDYGDAALPGKEQAVEQPVHEYEVSEVIDPKVLLDALDNGPLIAAAAITRIQDQHVDRRIQRPYRLGAADNRFEIGQFERKRCRLAAHALAGFLRTLQRTAGADDPGAAQGQNAHRLETNAGRTARNDGDLAGQVDVLRHLLGR